MAQEEKPKTTAVAVRTTRTDVSALSGDDLVAYLDMQLALMRKMKVSESLIFTHEIILRNDGSGQYELVKRANNKTAPEYGKEDHSRSINAAKGHSERTGIANMEKGGKYNDANKLMFSDYGTIEIGEFSPFASM